MSKKDAIASILNDPTMRLVHLADIVRTSGSDDLVKIAVMLDGPEYQNDPPAVSNEWLWAKRIAAGCYEIDNIPFFAKSFSLGDIVSCSSSSSLFDGCLVFADVVRHQGHSTYRIRLEPETHFTGADKYSIMFHINLLIDLGCEFELGEQGEQGGLIAVDAGPTVKLGGVAFVLRSGSDDKIWDWETGYIDENNEHL